MRCLNYCVKEGTPVYCGKGGRVILYWTAFQGFLVMLVWTQEYYTETPRSSPKPRQFFRRECNAFPRLFIENKLKYKIETFNNNVPLHALNICSIPYAIFYVC
uniref:Uncharacterized protein n=1 Tax=Glossina pallidipes TaxID=7398 RepID=A0A1A9ZGJ0_GLOPL